MAAGVSEKTLTLFNRYLAKHMGLHFPAPRLGELEQKMALAARELGYQEVEPCLLWLMSAPLSPEQLDVLAPVLTIGETYFLRDRESYRVLEEELLPELVAARRKEGKRLRIWSAGCSTGEEAYSIAILLERVIPDLESWDVTLCATDINAAALEKARLGVYRDWSFRNVPEWLFQYLVRRPDGRREVPPRTRRLVRFSRLNLAVDDFRSLFPEGGVDIVFCRNVMLYFDPELRSEVVGRFHQILGEGGWLFVSPTEVDHRIFSDFSCRRFCGALVFRKGHRDAAEHAARSFEPPPARPPSAAAGPAAAPIPSATSPSAGGAALPGRAQPEDSPLSQAAELAAQGRHLEAADAAAAALAQEPADADALDIIARSYASLGRFDEARHYCEAALAKDRLRPGSHYLLSIILEELGLLQEAAASLKRALYLDQDFLLALFALGRLELQAGKERESRRHFSCALRLLEQRDSHEVLPEAAGLTAGRLAQIIRSTLEGGSAHA